MIIDCRIFKQIIIVELGFLTGCHSAVQSKPASVSNEPASSITLHYSVTIPDGTPGRQVFNYKGVTQVEADGRLMYADAHRAGWNECLDLFLERKMELDSSEKYLSTYQEFGFTAEARESGFEECRKQLRRLVRKHGEQRVRHHLGS